MTEKSVTNQLSRHNGSFTLEDLYHVVRSIKSTPQIEQTLKVTAFEYMQIRRASRDIQMFFEIDESGDRLFGMRIEVAPDYDA